MKKKILLFLTLMVLLVLLLSIAFAAPVTNLKATGETGQVRLSWKGASQTDGYILYRQVGSSGSLSYLYITANQGFLDKTASSSQWNFYRVYPYRMVGGKRVVGPSNRYVYAKSISTSYDDVVYGLKATPNTGHNTISWSRLNSADGYSVFRLDKNANVFRHLKSLVGTTHDDFDFNPSHTYDNEFYRVYPYKRINGVAVFGKSNRYVYAKPQRYDAAIDELRGYRHPNHANGTAYFQWKKVEGASGYAILKLDKNRKGNIVATTTATSFKLTGLDSTVRQLYSVRPYTIVKGHKVLGYNHDVIIRAYGEPGKYYSGTYLVGTDIPAGTYKISADGSEGVYYIYKNRAYAGYGEVKAGDPPITETRFQKGVTVNFHGIIATKE